MLIWCFLCFCFLIFVVKAYVVGTHLNCIDKPIQFRWVPTTYSFIKKVDKKYTGCILKTTELLDCALIGVCQVIRLNTGKDTLPIWAVFIVHMKKLYPWLSKMGCVNAQADLNLCWAHVQRYVFWPRGYKTFFILSSAFSYLLTEKFSCSYV